MESYLTADHYDLVTPDGSIVKILKSTPDQKEVIVKIDHISPAFVGFKIDKQHVSFNIKSTLAQIGVNGVGTDYELDPKNATATIQVTLTSIGPFGKQMIALIEEGAYIGKLFAADPRRRVRDADYLFRMFGRSDRDGLPLLSLGGLQGSKDLILEKTGGYTVAFLSLKDGAVKYSKEIEGLLPTLAKALKFPYIRTRALLELHQEWVEGADKRLSPGELLLVRTLPLHIRTVFGRVVEELLPQGFHHTTANVLEPTTKASGDIYELYGESSNELRDIPLEFYTLEPHREHVFFSDRDQLQNSLESPQAIFKAFDTAPPIRSAIFIVKGEQMLNLKTEDWIAREVHPSEFPGLMYPERQSHLVQEYIEQQPSYPFLKAIERGQIVSQGILFSRYLPSPLMKKMLLGDLVQNCLKGIYFQYPSQSYGDYFSHEDRSMLLDLAKFAIPVFWADKTSGKVLRFVPKPDKDTGMFVPLDQIDNFIKATAFGIYGSNLIAGNFEEELTKLLEGIKELRKSVSHRLLKKDTPIALITGGGPGVMEVGNRVAKNVGVLSCANIVDFSGRMSQAVHEQKTNPYIDAKMTFRLDRLVERQAEFNLDFPIFLMGGIGTDFEYGLEEVRRKIGIPSATPVLLFGTHEYWRDKITSRFKRNLESGTIKGSEWVSNCFYCVQNAEQGLKVYEQFFKGTLPIGKGQPMYPEGFLTV